MTEDEALPVVAWRSVSTAGRSRRRARRSWPQRILLSVGVLVVTACLLAAAGVWYAKHRLDSVKTISLGQVLTPQGQTVSGHFPTRVENYLLVGSDTRAGAKPGDPDYGGIVGTEDPVGQRSDTIMILRYDPTTNSAAILSLPRDLYLPIAGTNTSNRINAAFFKGPDVLIKTITEDLGIPLHHYVEVDFQGFKRIVDAIGGVSIWFDHPVRDANTGLYIQEPGCVKMNGVMALEYARSRHLETKINGRWREDGTADLGRISRQQDFIRKALQKAVQKGTSNPLALNELLGAVVDNLTIDKGLDLFAFAGRLKSLQGTQIASYTVPADGKYIRGNAVLVMNEKQATPLLDYFRGGSAVPASTASSGASTRATSASTAKTTLAPPTTTRPIGTVPGVDKQCG